MVHPDAAPRRVSEAEALGRPPLPAELTEAYGPHEAQRGELRLPGGSGPHPVVVILHGGCWRAIADRRYMEPLAAALTDAGRATWNVGYRTVDHEGGGFPGTFQDVAAAVDHVRDLAARHPLDPGRVATLGHSAGGHLALWAAGRAKLPAGWDGGSAPDPTDAPRAARSQAPRPDVLRPHASRADGPLPVSAAIGLAPIADLEAFDALGRRGCGDAVRRLLGGPSVRRAGTASPARLLPLGVPQLLVVGAEDEVVPPGHVRGYARQARDAGDEVDAVVVEEAAHFEIVAPWWSGWEDVERRILGFLGER